MRTSYLFAFPYSTLTIHNKGGDGRHTKDANNGSNTSSSMKPEKPILLKLRMQIYWKYHLGFMSLDYKKQEQFLRSDIYTGRHLHTIHMPIGMSVILPGNQNSLF